MRTNNRNALPFFNTEINVRNETDYEKLSKFLNCLAQIPQTSDVDILSPKLIYISVKNNAEDSTNNFMLICLRKEADIKSLKSLKEEEILKSIL